MKAVLFAPTGLAPADRFLKSIVTKIEHSAAYNDNGLDLHVDVNTGHNHDDHNRRVAVEHSDNDHRDHNDGREHDPVDDRDHKHSRDRKRCRRQPDRRRSGRHPADLAVHLAEHQYNKYAG